ncbi:MAG: NirD/YgiW/YdeI family stress tolerance protein [Gammaproteobacteria bacterium]|nr:NirD/YgiW/YdeI family stress tolerance protein [Gammaproteobacteria bacterium]
MKRNTIFISSIIALGISAVVQAQYVGPATQKEPMTVADVLKNPVDDQDVVLRGHLIKKVGNEKYLFSDGSGEIRVEIESEDFPVQKIDDKTPIEIHGEIENNFLTSPEIDVEMISITQ